jgi:hypothetical protein
MVSYTHYEMFLHLLTPETKPARPSGNGWPLWGWSLLPSLLLPLSPLSSSQGSLVEEKILLWKWFLAITLTAITCKKSLPYGTQCKHIEHCITIDTVYSLIEAGAFIS